MVSKIAGLQINKCPVFLQQLLKNAFIYCKKVLGKT